ncbi:phage tail protein I [Ascidiaceihabitans sp.]|uniref:phage tail protein I n=1 Tax=Ascidiaceihabitans sp. TaxID=1872644 RepID=UPI003298A9CC
MSDLPTLLPLNAGSTEREFEKAFSRLHGVSNPIAMLWDPNRCPSNLLPYLAWAMSIEEWDPNWSDADKRSAVEKSVSIHRRKGTIGAIKQALKSAGYGDAEVIERFGWDFHDGGALHDGSIGYALPDEWAEYRVRLARPITVEQADQVRGILAAVAPVRCRLKALDFTEAFNAYNARISYDGQFTHGVA